MTLFKCDNTELQEYLEKVLQQVKGKNEKWSYDNNYS